MKMIDYNHFICHFHCRFSVFSHILLSGARNEFPGKSLMTSSSASVGKIISFRFHRLFPTLPIISPPFSFEFRTFIHNNNCNWASGLTIRGRISLTRPPVFLIFQRNRLLAFT